MDPTIRRHLFPFFMLNFPTLVTCFRHYEKNLIAVKKRKLQLKFLQDCVQEKVIPKSFLPFFRWKTTPFPELSRVTVLQHIAQLKREIDKIYLILRRNLRYLRSNLHGNLLDCALESTRNKCNFEVNSTRERLNRVLQDLCKASEWNNCGLSGSVLNLSSHVLSEIKKNKCYNWVYPSL
ncbi:hypothetical protein E2C01_091072 [Portunus trituberculatus]|uniref:Uncharacterized protein n=1 Tax=Portunus trituberculatus TaxID=210409 RepID=A0A5B7JN30_PORTR|nr:hypothetical protein [Portunus trituberculatus]